MELRFIEQDYRGGQSSEAYRGNVFVSERRQDGTAIVCLSAILAALLFLMVLSIYLVVTRPAPVSAPEDSGVHKSDLAFASVTIRPDQEPGRAPVFEPLGNMVDCFPTSAI